MDVCDLGDGSGPSIDGLQYDRGTKNLLVNIKEIHQNEEGLKIETHIVRTLLKHWHVHITGGRTETKVKWNVVLIWFGEIGRKEESFTTLQSGPLAPVVGPTTTGTQA